jgi:hypothetical protein
MTLPRTVGFLAGSGLRDTIDRLPGVTKASRPLARPTLAMATQVAMDEAILGIMAGPGRLPHRADYVRVGEEVVTAAAMWRRRGWLDNPASYHPSPPPLTDPAIRGDKSRGLRFERVTFPSGYQPHPGEPGADRWMSFVPNATASAWVLRHPGPPRSWLLCLHGLGMGSPISDLSAFRAARLYRHLGLNLVFPTMPLHGPRKVGRMGGDEFVGFDHLNLVHGLAQAVWDVRQVLSWVRAQDPLAIGVYGVSLGGYMTSLLAGLEPGLDLAIAGVPVVDFVRLFGHHCPPSGRARAREHHLVGELPTAVHRVVSPFAFEPQVAPNRRFVFIGIGDRMTTAGQGEALWEHWGRPPVAWYPGNHVGFMWSSKVSRFVDESLVAAGMVDAEAIGAP